MEKMKKIASALEKILKIARSVCTALVIAAAVCAGLVLLGFLLGWDPNTIATGYESLDIGFLELEIADAFAPEKWLVLLHAGIILAVCSAIAWILRGFTTHLLAIVKPMAEGQPFTAAASAHLKKLAILTVVLGFAFNCLDLVEQIFISCAYDLPGLLLSEKIAKVTLNYTFDLDFLFYGALVWLLSYAFGYGAQLQELSDETL